jgi:hypothetical protein
MVSFRLTVELARKALFVPPEEVVNGTSEG